jgi:hypothetical protein
MQTRIYECMNVIYQNGWNMINILIHAEKYKTQAK